MVPTKLDRGRCRPDTLSEAPNPLLYQTVTHLEYPRLVTITMSVV